jgi:dephospho-CoA kinase
MNNDESGLVGLALGRLKSIQTRKLNKLNKYVVKQSLAIQKHNKLIDNLIQTGLYTEIYNKINNDREEELSNEDLELLKTFNYISPDELDTLYK